MNPHRHFLHHHARHGEHHPGHPGSRREAPEPGHRPGPGFGRPHFGGRGEHPGFGPESGRGWGHGHGPGRGHGRGFGGPPFGPWGDPGERRERLERGLLRYLILDSLRDTPRHGYEIIKSLEERTAGRYTPS